MTGQQDCTGWRKWLWDHAILIGLAVIAIVFFVVFGVRLI